MYIYLTEIQYRITMEIPVQFDDEFDELQARATSGGSLYGLLRRQAFLQGGHKVVPENDVWSVSVLRV